MPPKAEIPTWLKTLLESQEQARKKDEEARQRAEEARDAAHREEIQLLRDLITGNQNSIQQQPSFPSQAERPDKPSLTPRPPLLQEDTTYSKFKSWRETWQDYTMLIQLEKLPPGSQRAHLRSCISEEMRSYIKCALGITKETEMTVDAILDSIENHLRQRRNIAIDRVAFVERRQQEGESFDSFYVSIKKLAEEADLCNECIEQRLVTRIMSGVRSKELKQKLLAINPFPKLKDVIDICRSYESSIRDCSSLDEKSINKLSTYRKNKKEKMKRTSSKSENCSYCGKNEIHERSNCPARDSKCRNCNKTGHWDIACKFPRKEKAKVKYAAYEDSQEEEDHVHNIVVNNVNLETPRVTIKYSHKKKSCTKSSIPDTGAEVTVAGRNLLQDLKLKEKDFNLKENRNLYCANNTKMDVIGTALVKLKLNDVETEENIVFCENQNNILLSWKACKRLSIIPQNFPTQLKVNTIKELSIPEMKKKLLEDYQDVFQTEEELKKMAGEPMKIHLQEDSEPYAIYTARSIPHAWRDEVKRNIDEMVSKGIIEAVGDEPMEWCHPMVVVGKSGGGVRVCVDLTHLNKQIHRPIYPTKTPQDAISNIKPGSKYFTKVDAKQGYWQIPLEESSQHLTCFLTPWGRYKFLRAPMGLSSTGDEYCRRHNQAISEHLNMQKVMDDVLLYDEDITEHYNNVKSFLDCCRTNSITLNPKKFCFGEKTVDFVGYKINEEGVSVDDNKIEAIRSYPTPRNVTDLKSFMGLINQLSNFSSSISRLSEPLRSLLKRNSTFLWLPVHDAAFQATKEALCNPPILSHFDPKKPTILQTDASKNNGLGYALLQKHDSEWKMIQCGSRYLTETESRYAIIELELLAVVWAMKKCQLYLLGLDKFLLHVDHRPLVCILDKKHLGEIENPRLQRLKEKILKFNFVTEWVKGKEHCIPDALSRAPVAKPTPEDSEAEEVINLKIHAATLYNEDEGGEEKDLILKNLAETCKKDEDYEALRKYIKKGFPIAKKQLEPPIRPYWNIRNYLSVDKDTNLVIYDGRIVIPKKARRDILQKLHISHQGAEKTKRRARQAVYWPCMNSDIDNTVSSCEKCHEKLPSLPKEPLKQEKLPSRVFEEVSIDLFQCAGKYFLLYTDRLSGWPVVYRFARGETTSKKVIVALRRCFMDLGVPVILRSDCGPQFTSKEFIDFLESWNVKHIKSTPYHPQSNSVAESAVKSMKKLILTSTENGDIESEAFHKALLEWRNTPREGGLSPAQVVFGRPLRSCVPAHHRFYDKKWKNGMTEYDAKRSSARKKAKAYYDRTTKPLEPLERGCCVWIQNPISKKWDTTGTVVEIGKHRDYHVRTPSGKVYWRNRRFLRL